MEDLFEREQNILDQALVKVEKGSPVSAEEYAFLTEEYRRLLKQLRRITRISDKTAINLNFSKHSLENKVNLDELTGIYNRRFLDDRLADLICSLIQEEGLLSILMIDVDFFKQYNDTYGHGKGDECLRRTAQTISSCAAPEDAFAARYGGEEFVMVLPHTSAEAATAIADRILEGVRQCRIPHAKNTVADCITVSIGITTGVVKPFHTMEDFIRVSDKALYLSKKNGRNRKTFITLGERL